MWSRLGLGTNFEQMGMPSRLETTTTAELFWDAWLNQKLCAIMISLFHRLFKTESFVFAYPGLMYRYLLNLWYSFVVWTQQIKFNTIKQLDVWSSQTSIQPRHNSQNSKGSWEAWSTTSNMLCRRTISWQPFGNFRKIFFLYWRGNRVESANTGKKTVISTTVSAWATVSHGCWIHFGFIMFYPKMVYPFVFMYIYIGAIYYGSTTQ